MRWRLLDGLRAVTGRLAIAAAFVFSALLISSAAAQPYAAGGGFSRPEMLSTVGAVPSLALAVASDGSNATLVWANSAGVWSTKIAFTPDANDRVDKTPELLIPSVAARDVNAAYIGGELAVAWVERDRRSGVFMHQVSWRGEPWLLFEDAVVVPLKLLEWDGRPWVAAALRREGEARLMLLPVGSRDPEAHGVVLHRTELAVRGFDVVVSGSELWLSWLEGISERTEVGLVSDWSALTLRARGPADTVTVSSVIELGEADVTDERQTVRLSVVNQVSPANRGAQPDDDGSGAWLLWPDADGQLRASLVSNAPEGPAVSFTSAPLGAGRAVGAAWPYVYWLSGSSVRRLDLRELPAETEAINVAWAPITIEAAALGYVDAPGASFPTHNVLAWFGRAQGGAVQVFHSSDAKPMARTWRDRLAASMGWSPWHLWDELIGQSLTALLAGVLLAIASVPLLLVFGPLLARFFATPRAAVAAGLVIGTLPLVIASVLLAVNLSYGAEAPVRTVAETASSAVAGVVVGWLASLRGDREAQGAVSLSAAMTIFASFTLWAFLTYQNWAPIIGLA